MKELPARLLAIVIMISLSSTSACVSKATYEEVERQLQHTEDKVALLTDDLSAIRQDLASINGMLKSAQSELTATKTSLKITQKGLADAKDSLEDAEAALRPYKETLGTKVFSEVQPPYRKASMNGFVQLANNESATDPTWQQLVDFILADDTDSERYSLASYICGDFAEKLHNNAESAGIRAAFIAVHYENKEIGHALNAFNTTDRGLVYVDSSGFSSIERISTGSLHEQVSTMAVDKMAYLVKGKDIGFISLSRDTSPDYGYYEQMKKDWQSYGEQLEVYNEQVRAYTKEISGKVYYIETPEWEGIKQWESWLTQQRTMLEIIREQLEYVWNSHGTVNSIEIYW